jgi:hypothetical protein
MRGIPLRNTWIGHEEADILTNIQKSSDSLGNALQSMKHTEEDPNSTQRVNWKQKISEEKKNLISLEHKHIEFQNASSVGLLLYFEKNGGCPVELLSSKRNEQISVFLNTVTLQMQGELSNSPSKRFSGHVTQLISVTVKAQSLMDFMHDIVQAKHVSTRRQSADIHLLTEDNFTAKMTRAGIPTFTWTDELQQIDADLPWVQHTASWWKSCGSPCISRGGLLIL